MAQTFSEKINGDSYNTYKIQHILPFALINTIFNIFGWDKSNTQIMTAMIILCILVVIVSLICFFKTSNTLRLNTTLEIIAFSAIFYNYPILKHLGYYPLQTNIFAFMLGIMIFYFFIKREKWLIILTGILLIVIYSSVYIIIHLLVKGESNFDLQVLIVQTSLRATAKPIVFLEAHFIYFGPIALLIIFLWKSYISYVAKYGYGFNFLEFPAQLYFMNSGSWQNWTTYFIFMTIIIIYAFLIWYGVRVSPQMVHSSTKKVAPLTLELPFSYN